MAQAAQQPITTVFGQPPRPIVFGQQLMPTMFGQQPLVQQPMTSTWSQQPTQNDGASMWSHQLAAPMWAQQTTQCHQACECGAEFKSDSNFCHVCGVKRPMEEPKKADPKMPKMPQASSEDAWLEAWFKQASGQKLSDFCDEESLYNSQNFGYGLCGEPTPDPEESRKPSETAVQKVLSAVLSAEAPEFVPGGKSINIDNKISTQVAGTSDVSTADGESEPDEEKSATDASALLNATLDALEAVTVA